MGFGGLAVLKGLGFWGFGFRALKGLGFGVLGLGVQGFRGVGFTLSLLLQPSQNHPNTLAERPPNHS